MSSKAGCYASISNGYPYHHEEIEIPLKSLRYDVELSDSIVFLQLEQTYVNTLKKILDVQYVFPINPSAAIYQFEISFGGRITKGVVKAKEDAQRQFNQHQDEGRQAGYFSYSRGGKDVMKVRLGNISPGQEIKVKISYVHTVSVVLNSFYQFRLNTTITPRYVSKLQPNKIIFGQHFDKYAEGICSWFLRIKLRSSRKVKSCFSKTHKINPQLKRLTQDTSEVIIQQNDMTPNKDFVLDYSFENMDKPCVLLGQSDNQTQAVISFVPKFCSLNHENALKLAMQSKEIPLSLSKIKAEYVFFLDRSGSMGGERIAKAKEALIVFLKSLPPNSFFNVVSFGTGYELLYPQSKKYTQELVNQAVENINNMDSNLGGTEILQPLKEYLLKPSIEEYPRQIFLLTDGAVDDTASIQAFVGNHTKFSRVHTIGIGYGASEDLILGCAQKGKGYSVMISDDEDPSNKIIDILQKSLSPVISKLQLQYEKEKVISVVPNPEKNPYILKNQVANFYLTFNGKLSSPFPVTIQYTDSLGLHYCEKLEIKPHSVPTCPYLSKLVGHNSLNALYSVYKYGQSKEDHLYYVKEINKEQLQAEIIKQSIEKQLLCELTAFICVNDSIPDAVSKEKTKEPKQSIKINPMNPVDHSNCLKVVFGGRNQYYDDSSDDCFIDECAIVEQPLNYRYNSQETKKVEIKLPPKQRKIYSIDLKEKNNRQICAASNSTEQKVNVYDIIKLQNVNGMWCDDQLLGKLQNDKIIGFIKQIFGKIISKQAMHTLAVIEHIKTYFSKKEGKKLVLILRKAQEYLQNNCPKSFQELEKLWNDKIRQVTNVK